MFKLFKSGLLLIAVSFFATSIQAQEKEQSVLYSEMQQAHINGIVFTPIQLFSIVDGSKHDALQKETILQPETDKVNRLYQSAPNAIALTLQTAEGDSYVLEMMRSNPFAAGANVGYYDANGAHSFAYDKGVHYQGAVAGAQKSLAAMSVFANGDIMILFANDKGNFVAGKLDDNSNRYILYNDKDFTISPPTVCGVTDDMQIRDVPVETGGKTTAAYVCKKVSLYWEVDYELFQSKQSSTLIVQGYVTGLFNQVQTLYRNEQVAVELKTLYMWTVDDGYADGSSGAALNSFRSTWNGKNNNFDGDLAMLLALDAGGLGGVAYLGGMCYKNVSYAYGDVTGAYSTVPTYSWDVTMVTHEIGHNIGSPHTHWCGWNTGAGGSCGAIDNCTSKDAGNGCNTCGSTFLNSQPTNAWQGTIMSYCHLVNRGVNLANGFGPLPSALIRQEVNGASCLSSIISAELVATELCRDSGFISVVFDTTAGIGTNHFGTSPNTFIWSHGANTQNIKVNQTGSFQVTVIDSNGCSRTFSTLVSQNTDDSCKITSGNNSVGSIQQQYVTMFPNPAHGKVALKFFSYNNADLSVKITDLTGRTIKTIATEMIMGNNNLTIDIGDMQAGMYYILLSAPGQQYEGLKLVVE